MWEEKAVSFDFGAHPRKRVERAVIGADRGFARGKTAKKTNGYTVVFDDGRVFAEFARAILERRDIVLKTEGTTARCYCYLGDAVTAVETILEKGEVATPYTVANETTFCTVRKMAEALCAAHPESGSKVVFDFDDAAARGFAPPFRMRLDCSRLRALGWEPQVGLMEMFDRMMVSLDGQRSVGV